MKNGIVIADSGPIISLALIDKLNLLNELFIDVKIARAVWNEITADQSKPFFEKISLYFKDKVQEIKSFNELTFVMDYGESESVILYKESGASFLLIDDKKAREIAENLGVNCVGTIGILSIAKDKGLVLELRPLFKAFIQNNRYYSINLLNSILTMKGESSI